MSMTEKTRTSRSTGVKTMTIIFLLIVGIGIIVLLQTKDSMNLTGKARLGKGAKANHLAYLGDAEPEDLQRWASLHLAAYKRPKSIEHRTELPRTASGKVKRLALA